MASAQKKHAQVSKEAAFSCFLLAVHILAAGKKRKEEACSPGEGRAAQIPQDVASLLPAHPLVTGLLAKVSHEQLRGRKATTRGSRHSTASDNTSPPHSLSTKRQHRHPSWMKDSTEILATVMDPRQGVIQAPLNTVPEPAALCLACHVNMSHPTRAGNKRQSLTATSPVFLVLSDLDKKQRAFGRYPYSLVHCISAENSLLLPK